MEAVTVGDGSMGNGVGGGGDRGGDRDNGGNSNGEGTENNLGLLWLMVGWRQEKCSTYVVIWQDSAIIWHPFSVCAFGSIPKRDKKWAFYLCYKYK